MTKLNKQTKKFLVVYNKKALIIFAESLKSLKSVLEKGCKINEIVMDKEIKDKKK